MKRKFIAPFVALGFYGMLVAMPALPDRLILFPTTNRIDAGGGLRVAVPFQEGEVEVWRAASRKATKGRAEFFVLRFYGNADRAERWVADEAEMWGGRAVEVWGVNYPGYGGRTGPARLATMGPAALAAFDALQTEAGERPIVVFGASLGTTTALHIATQRPVAGLILHNPPAIREIILGQFGWWNLWLLAGPWAQRIPDALDSAGNARASKARAIFLLAERDEVVAPKYQRVVVEAYAGEKRVISLAGASHNSPVEMADWEQVLGELDWVLAGRR